LHFGEVFGRFHFVLSMKRWRIERDGWEGVVKGLEMYLYCL
jgi:hypothetical protein